MADIKDSKLRSTGGQVCSADDRELEEWTYGTRVEVFWLFLNYGNWFALEGHLFNGSTFLDFLPWRRNLWDQTLCEWLGYP
jgi:hypothetical protein